MRLCKDGQSMRGQGAHYKAAAVDCGDDWPVSIKFQLIVVVQLVDDGDDQANRADAPHRRGLKREHRH